MEIYNTKYFVETVLYGLTKSELHRGQYDKYEIRMYVFDDTYDTIYFYIPKDCVQSNQDGTFKVILTEKEYLVSYLKKDGEYYQELVHRYVLCEAYYEVYPTRQKYAFDLLCVPASAILKNGPCFHVSFLSSKITLGSFVSLDIDTRDLHWVYEPDLKLPTQYAHIDLSSDEYIVWYKNKQTGWKDVKVVVSCDDIRQDFLYGKRAAAAGISPKRLLEFLSQERECSHLFAE